MRNYIRNAEDQVTAYARQLKDAEQGEKHVGNEGHLYGGVNYKLSQIVDKPLQETYTPLPVSDAQVDLREGFTAIRSQGALGSCSAFALASVMEYIIKRGSGKDVNLSEHFLYYNTRAMEGKEAEDTGASIHDAITSLSKQGICIEEMAGYSVDRFDVKPPEAAYEEAMQRRVLKAKNVNREKDDIRSALSEGYPVVISLRIPEDFGKGPRGFVSMPSDDEIDKIEGSHAMVICGYSDTDRFFIVRNSWGKDFGDDGYCYIPYRYITDKRLLNAAYIITETTVDTSRLVIRKTRKVSFNSTDAAIRIAILNNLIGDERELLAHNQGLYNQAMQDYSYMLGRIQNGGVRDTIRDNSVVVNSEEIKAIEANEEMLRERRQRDLNELRRLWFKVAIGTGVTLLGLVIAIICCLGNPLAVRWLGISAGIDLLLAIAFFAWYKNGQNGIRRRYDDALAYQSERRYELERKNQTVALQSHIYGVFINRFIKYRQRVSETYNRLRSFNLNLQT